VVDRDDDITQQLLEKDRETDMENNRNRSVILGAMCFALFMASLDDSVVNLALPQIQGGLRASVSELQWILNIHTLMSASLVLTLGTLADLYGRKRIFLAGLTVFTLSSTICGFSPNVSWLLVGRALQGMGVAAILPGAIAILSETFPEPKENAKVMSLWAALSGLAIIVGPVLGGFFIDAMGWQSVFFFNLPLGIIGLALTNRVVPESVNPISQRVDWLGLILSWVAIASFTYVLIEGGNLGWRSSNILGMLLLSGMSGIVFLIVEHRSRHPMLPLHLFRNSTFTVSNVIGILVFFNLASLMFLFSLFLQTVQGYSASLTGISFLPMNGAFILGALLSGRFITQRGFRAPLVVGLVAASLALLLLDIDTDTGYGSILGNLIVMGGGIGLTLSPRTSLAMSAVSRTHMGVGAAVVNASNRLGGVFGIALMGAVLTERINSNLRYFLTDVGIANESQTSIIADITHGRTHHNLPSEVDPLALKQIVQQSFVAGTQVALLIGILVLLIGIALSWVFLKPVVVQKNVV
jgi:EmrB/QacA subfamily drug resistance transporter